MITTKLAVGPNKDRLLLVGNDYPELVYTLIRGAELVPCDPAGFMRFRNDNIDNNSGDIDYWDQFHTDFGIAVTKDRVFVMPRSKLLRGLTMDSARNYRFPLPQGDSLPEGVIAYNRSDLLLNQDLTDEQARAFPIWLDLANGDQRGLDKYVENTFRLGKDRLGTDKMMGVNIPVEGGERSVLVMGGLESKSGIYSRDILDRSYISLLGLKSEA